jgi:hypothetical protein
LLKAAHDLRVAASLEVSSNLAVNALYCLVVCAKNVSTFK